MSRVTAIVIAKSIYERWNTFVRNLIDTPGTGTGTYM